MAELLGFPHATIVMEVEPQAGSVRVKRELEDGWFQHVTMPQPVVLTIQSGIKRLRYATLMGIKKAKTKKIDVLDASSLNAAGTNATETVRVYLPERSKHLQLFSGDSKQIAHELVEKLRFEARAI